MVSIEVALDCPIHSSTRDKCPDECTLVERHVNALLSKQPPVQSFEPPNLCAVVIDVQGRRYVRWSHDNHTHTPWRMIGAVHIDTDDLFSWEDLPAVSSVQPGVLS